MIRSQFWAEGMSVADCGGAEQIERWQHTPGSVLWLDLQAEDSEAERQLLQQTFAIHELTLQDMQRPRHPPKLENFDHYCFLMFKALRGEGVVLEHNTLQLSLLVGERFFITRRVELSPSTDKLWEQSRDSRQWIERGPAALALRLARNMVDRYQALLLRFESRLDELEDDMVAEPNDTMLAEIIHHKSELKKLRRLFLYHSEIFAALRRDDSPLFPHTLEHEIIDVFEQQERAQSLTQLFYELASDLIDGYISLASHRLNNIMKVLTIITAIFVPLGLVAGIYGMNFDHIPELHVSGGYYWALGFMASIVVALLAIFRKYRWL